MTFDKKPLEFFEYKVNNSKPGEEETSGGIKVIKTTINGNSREKEEVDILPSVRAVVLFGAFETNTSQFAKPAKFPHPLLKDAKIADLAQLQSQFEGLGSVALTGAISKLTDKVSSLITENSPVRGFVDLLDPRYKEESELRLSLKCFDIGAKRQFSLTLKGQAIQFNSKDSSKTAPIWAVFNGKSACYYNVVSLGTEQKSIASGAVYHALTVKVEKEVSEAALPKVLEMAQKAKTSHLKKITTILNNKFSAKPEAKVESAPEEVSFEDDF